MTHFRFLLPTLAVFGCIATSANAASGPVLANGYTVQLEVLSHGSTNWYTVYSSSDRDDAIDAAAQWYLAVEFDFAEEMVINLFQVHLYGEIVDVRMIYVRVPLTVPQSRPASP